MSSPEHEPVVPVVAGLERDLIRGSMRSRHHPRRPSWTRTGFQHGTRRQPNGQAWSVVAFTDDEGPAADVAVDTGRVRFDVTGVRRTGTRGRVAGEANRDWRDGVLLLSWLTDPTVATLVLDTDQGPLSATLWGDITAERVRLFLAVVEDTSITVTGARHLDDSGDVLAVEDLAWVAVGNILGDGDHLGDGPRMARTADDIAEILAEQDRVDASRGSVFRIELADPEV